MPEQAINAAYAAVTFGLALAAAHTMWSAFGDLPKGRGRRPGTTLQAAAATVITTPLTGAGIVLLTH